MGDILDCLASTKIFSNMDLKSGYHQIEFEDVKSGRPCLRWRWVIWMVGYAFRAVQHSNYVYVDYESGSIKTIYWKFCYSLF